MMYIQINNLLESVLVMLCDSIEKVSKRWVKPEVGLSGSPAAIRPGESGMVYLIDMRIMYRPDDGAIWPQGTMIH